MQTLNLDKLPPLARAELVDFYEFLLKKYAPSEVAQGRAEMESRWKKVAERVHHDTRYPGGWSDSLKQEMQSFRESFRFQHDDR